MNANPRVMIIIGAALLASALIMLVLGVFFRDQQIVAVVLWICAALDTAIGLLFLLLGIRKAGQPPH